MSVHTLPTRGSFSINFAENRARGNRKSLKWLKTVTKSNFRTLKLKSHEEYLIYLRTIFYYAKDSFRFGPKCTDIRYARVQSRDTRTRNMYFVVSGMLYPPSYLQIIPQFCMSSTTSKYWWIWRIQWITLCHSMLVS